MCFFKKRVEHREIKYLSPAVSDSDSLVSGNGDYAVFVRDGANRQTLTIYLDGFFARKSDKSNNFDKPINTKYVISQIKKNLACGNNSGAQKIIQNLLLSNGFEENYCSNVPLCELVLNFKIDTPPYSFSRSLSLKDGLVSSSFNVGSGIIARKTFVSLDGTICYEAKCDDFSLDCDITLCPPQIALSDEFPNQKLDWQTYIDGEYVIYTCSLGSIRAGVVCLIQNTFGEKSSTQNFVKVKGEQSFCIYTKAFLSQEIEGEQIDAVKTALKATSRNVESLAKEKTKYLSQELQKCEVKITKNKSTYTERELVNLKAEKSSLCMIEDLYYYGKYLALSLGNISLHASHLFFNLDQSKNVKSPFEFENSQHKLDICSQNYLKVSRIMSFAFQNGLDMRTKEYLTFLFHYIDDFKANAVNLFGYEGTFVPSVMAYNSGQIGSYKPDVIFNKNFSASIFDIIYRYYLASDDKKFMQEVGYEFASRIAQFFLSSLKLNKQSKMFDSSFGISPFSTPKGQSAMLYQSPTVDFENCKYIFYCMAKLSGEFDEDASRASVWLDAYAKVPDMEVDKDGIIKEYNIGSNQTDNCSPFLSHTFPYNLGTRAMSAKRDYDALIAGSAKYRFSCCCGKFSSRDLIEIALALATCGEGEDCFFVLETLLQGFLMNNLMFSFCDNSGLGIGQSNMPNYVNIDVSTAFCACLTNIFLTSSENNVYLFKTLPKRIENAVINGLTIKKGVTAFLSINAKRRIVILKLSAQQDEIVNIFVPNSYIRHVGSSAKMDRKECVLKAVELKKNKPLKLKIFY